MKRPVLTHHAFQNAQSCDNQNTTRAFVLDNVTVTFGSVDALSEVTLVIRSGEALALVGPSGAGKTTLMRLLNASVRPTTGRLLIRDVPVSGMSCEELRGFRASVGFVHQDLRLVPNISVHHNVLAGRLGAQSFAQSLRTMLLPGRAAMCEVYETLQHVGIPEKLFERTDRLSGGQRQRVAIARALFQQPIALLADEPIASVDPTRARSVIELLIGVCRERSITLCVSLHNLDLAREYFPRLVGMRTGRTVFDCAADKVSGEQFEALYDLDCRQVVRNAS